MGFVITDDISHPTPGKRPGIQTTGKEAGFGEYNPLIFDELYYLAWSGAYEGRD
jgi:hypothetical protein